MRQHFREKKTVPAEETGSLSCAFKIIDENGCESGALTIGLGGGVILRDENNNVFVKFKQDTVTQGHPAETEAAATSDEAKSEDQGEES